MNRRTFLKATGITILITTIPTMAKPEPTPTQWICAKDTLPKVGKEVIVKVTGGYRRIQKNRNYNRKSVESNRSSSK